MSQSHFSFEVTSSQIGLLQFTNQLDTMNVLHGAALRELETHLNQLATGKSSVRGLVIYSGKPDHFVVGADIKDIEALRQSPENPHTKVKEGAEYMQHVFQLIADLRISTVCAIHGSCLGGGLELALACDYRLLSNHAKTKLGFPEVQLGLIPGAGGTQRLPRLIGLVPSIELITSAKKIDPRKALKLGLVHGVVGERQLLELAIQFAHSSTRRAQHRTKSRKLFKHKLTYLAIEKNPLARRMIFNTAKKKINQQTSGFYPAPMLALAAIRDGYQLPLNLGLKKEAGYFADLAMSTESLSLTHLFHATTYLKKSPYADTATSRDSAVPEPAQATVERAESVEAVEKAEGDALIDTELVDEGLSAGHSRDIHQNGSLDQDPHASSVQQTSQNLSPLSSSTQLDSLRVGVVGAGFMGSGIATLCAARGIPCRITDPSAAAINKAYRYAAKYFNQRVKKRRIKAFEKDQALMSISATTAATAGLHRCSVVIEAVTENLLLKQKILKNLEAQAPADWVFASNTSALPITDIAAVAKNPARVVGMHFFSPAEKMPLCEIVKTISSDESAVKQAFRLASELGKQVIVVDDGPGFYTTRTLAFFLAESVRLLEDGAKVEDIDKAMKQFGFPVGPLTLLDEVGIDVGVHVLSTMVKAFPGRIYESKHVAQMLDKQFLGRKTAKGIYLYKHNQQSADETALKKCGVNEAVYQIFQPKGSSRSLSIQEIQTRLSLVFVNESIKCLEDKILAHPYDGDVGAVFGLGFPPFLGGPFYYADTLGASQLVDKLTQLQQQLGQSFKPSSLLKKQAAGQGSFYGSSS